MTGPAHERAIVLHAGGSRAQCEHGADAVEGSRQVALDHGVFGVPVRHAGAISTAISAHISARSRRIHRSLQRPIASQGLNMTLALEGFVPASERCFEASSNVDIAANFRHPVWKVMGTSSTVAIDQQASCCCRRCCCCRCCCGGLCCGGGGAHLGRCLHRIRWCSIKGHSTRSINTILSERWCS